MSRLRDIAQSPMGWPLRQGERVASAAVVSGFTTYTRLAARGRPVDASQDSRVTAVVKTFERPATASRFVRHLRRVFSGRIVLVDDSRTPMDAPAPGVDVLALPFDSGISRGRQAGVEAVDTPFTLIADDDHVFTRTVDLAAAVGYLDANPKVHAIAFTVVEVPRWYTIDFPNDETSLFPGHGEPLFAPDATFGGLAAKYKTAQCYLARTDALRDVGWDPELRMLDHSDFYSRAAGRMVFVQDEGMIVLHARTPWRRRYTARRADVAPDGVRLAQKWSVGGEAA